MDASLFPFLHLVDKKRWQSREAADSGFVGVLVWSSKWNRCEMEKSHWGSSAFKNEILQSCTDQSWTDTHWDEAQLFSWGKGPKFNNASITGQPTCSYDMYGKNYLALQLFFFPSRQLLRFDFNALCSFVFSCKNLTVLECLYFIKCVKKFWLLYPRIAVIIHVAVSNFFLWKRSEKREENTKHFLQQCWLIYICKCEVCFHEPCIAFCLE